MLAAFSRFLQRFSIAYSKYFLRKKRKWIGEFGFFCIQWSKCFHFINWVKKKFYFLNRLSTFTFFVVSFFSFHLVYHSLVSFKITFSGEQNNTLIELLMCSAICKKKKNTQLPSYVKGFRHFGWVFVCVRSERNMPMADER